MNLSNKGNFIIDDNLEISPKKMLIQYDSLASENSGRTLDGVMHIYWVFNKMRKLEIELRPCSSEYAAAVLSRVQGKEYDIKYYDVVDNAVRTIHCYTSNSSADIYSGVVRNGLYQGVKFNAIEIAGEISYAVQPAITANGDLVLTLNNTSATFTRVSNDLYVDDLEPGITYAIESGDLIQYES